MRVTLFILFILFFHATNFARTVYVKTAGNDALSGLTDANAWATLTKVNTSIVSFDTVFLNRGDTFTGTLRLTVPVTILSYGSGSRPVINGFTRVNSWANISPFIWESTTAISTLDTLKGVKIDTISTWVPAGRYPNADAANGGFLNYTTTGSNTKVKVPGIAGLWDSAAVVMRVEKYVLAIPKVIDQSTDTITFTPIYVWVPRNNFGLFFQDHAGTLDQQNEWYYNHTTKKLRVYSAAMPVNVYVPVVDTLIAVSANNVTIDGVQIIGSNRKAIAKINSGAYTNVTIRNCNINFSGQDAIDFNVGNNTGLTVEDNTISNSNNLAVVAGAGCAYANVNRNIIINSGNLIGMAPNLGDYSAIQTGGKGTNANFNTVQNTGYNAIQIGLDSSKANNNYIVKYAFIKDDGAALYTYTGSSNTEYFGREFKNNIVRNGVGVVYGVGASPKPAAEAIYPDDNSSGITIQGNTVDSCSKDALLLHNARNIVVRDNLFYNCLFGLAISDDFLGNAVSGLVIKNNKFIAKTATQFTATFYSTTNNAGAFGVIDSNIYSRPIMDSNTIKIEFPNHSFAYRTLAYWKAYSGKDAASSIGFAPVYNVSEFDFQVNPTPATFTYNFFGISKKSVTNFVYNNTVNIAPWSSNLFFANGTAVYSPRPPLSSSPAYLYYRGN